MPHYENAVIYKIHSLNPDVKEVYVGSTCDFANRKYNHKKCCNNPNDNGYNYKLYKYIRENGGWDKFMMTPIKMYPCNSKMELHIEERKNIEELNATLNSDIPSRTKKEYMKEYNNKYKEQNKEKIKAYDKKYRQKRKAYQQSYQQSYKIKNKEKLKAYRRARYAKKKQINQVNTI